MTINGIPYGRAAVGTREEINGRETVETMGDGTVRARVAGPSTRTLTFLLPRLTNVEWNTLRAQIEAVKFGSQVLTVVDDYGTSYQCRYWGGSLRGESRLGRFWQTEITFRVEN